MKSVDPNAMVDVNARRPSVAASLVPQKYLIMGLDWPAAIPVARHIPRALRNYITSNFKLSRQRKKTAEWQDYLGCDLPTLKAHLESQWEEGMNWDNYGQGGWVLRYIKPLSEFNMSIEANMREAFNYKNIRPGTPQDHVSGHDFKFNPNKMPPAPRSDAEAYEQALGIYRK